MGAQKGGASRSGERRGGERRSAGPRIREVRAEAYRIPTERPESDGTLEWRETGMVVVRARGGGEEGLGWSYTAPAAAALVEQALAPLLTGRDALAPAAAWAEMVHAVRNVGLSGVASSAISAVDVALWDLHARLLGLPLVRLLGPLRDAVPVYGSGGFTSEGPARVAEELGAWAEAGLRMVKMKVGRDPARDPPRLDAARRAIGDEVELFVDANGAFGRKEALHWAERYAAEWDARWFEEPVSSDDLEGLRLLRDRGPARLRIAAGEYGWALPHFRALLVGGCVDVLQADATRCGGVTPFLRVAALADAFEVPLSAHTAPALHAPLCCAAPRVVHLEWFRDHARVERMLFDGARDPVGGELRPNVDAPGHGLSLKAADAAAYRARAA